MKKLITITTTLISLTILSSCAHTHKVQGTQEKEEIPAGIRVGIGGKEIKEGDKVKVLKTECQTTQAASKRATSVKACKDIKVGEATVIKVLDHDSAIILPENNLQIDNTMKVEKQ